MSLSAVVDIWSLAIRRAPNYAEIGNPQPCVYAPAFPRQGSASRILVVRVLLSERNAGTPVRMRIAVFCRPVEREYVRVRERERGAVR